MQADTSIEDLEALIPDDDDEDHGICPICYPKDKGIQISLCGVDVSNEPIIPYAECTNICKKCMALGIPHALRHTLGRI